MGFHMRDLPVYIMLAAAFLFLVYVIIKSRIEDKDKQDKEIKK